MMRKLNNIFLFVLVLALAAPFGAFAQPNSRKASMVNMNYGSNILRLSPITAMDIGVGFGLSYEKIFGHNQTIGIVIPVNLLLVNTGNNDVYSGAYNERRFDSYVYFTPGVKFYPFGQRKVTYAVGPNLMLGYGGSKQWQSVTDLNGQNYLSNVTTTRVRLGVLINNYVNFQVSRLFNVGMEGGLGMRFYDRTSYDGSSFYAGNGDIHDGFDITGQFSLTVGLRF